ncbi:MAG: hypothetical protein HQL41_09130 [Alphaproteobacteria bacterium]|nr:hypothetical protein [Alphaproteobacteria bacterium]
MKRSAFIALVVAAGGMGAGAASADDWSPRPGSRYFDEGVYVDRVDLATRSTQPTRDTRAERAPGPPVATMTVTQTKRGLEFYDEGGYREAYPFAQPSFR